MQDKLSGFGQNLYLKVYKALIAYIIEQISLQPFTIISTAASTARVLAIPSIDREPFYPTNRCCPPCCGAIHLLHSFFHQKYRPPLLQCLLCHTFRHIFFLLVTCGGAASAPSEGFGFRAPPVADTARKASRCRPQVRERIAEARAENGKGAKLAR